MHNNLNEDECESPVKLGNRHVISNEVSPDQMSFDHDSDPQDVEKHERHPEEKYSNKFNGDTHPANQNYKFNSVSNLKQKPMKNETHEPKVNI